MVRFITSANMPKRDCNWDVLKYVIKKCKEYKMEIHPYINVFVKGRYLLKENPSWSEKRFDRTTLLWNSLAIFLMQGITNIV